MDDDRWQSYNTVYTSAKAGMEGVDKEKVQRIVYEMSKGSKYFQNEERKESFIKHKVQNMRLHFSNLTHSDLSHYQKIADKRILELEASRDLSRIWLHVDMDAFYAAVETLSNPMLKGIPIAVGTMSMISTANYEVCFLHLLSSFNLFHYLFISFLSLFRPGNLEFVLPCLALLHGSYVQS